MNENEELASIAEQAAHWRVVLQDPDPSAAERREFVEWVMRGPSMWKPACVSRECRRPFRTLMCAGPRLQPKTWFATH